MCDVCGNVRNVTLTKMHVVAQEGLAVVSHHFEHSGIGVMLQHSGMPVRLLLLLLRLLLLLLRLRKLCV